mgnify:CR=1 FL=1
METLSRESGIGDLLIDWSFSMNFDRARGKSSELSSSDIVGTRNVTLDSIKHSL